MSYNDSRPCCHCGHYIDPLELCLCRKAQRDWYRRRTCMSDDAIEKAIDEGIKRREEREREVMW